MNPSIDFIQPFGCERDILPIHPRLPVSGSQFLEDALNKIYILARIGDEYISHISYPLSAKL
jgi:hypothetical protein